MQAENNLIEMKSNVNYLTRDDRRRRLRTDNRRSWEVCSNIKEEGFKVWA